MKKTFMFVCPSHRIQVQNNLKVIQFKYIILYLLKKHSQFSYDNENRIFM